MVRDILRDEDDGPIEADLLGSAADLLAMITKGDYRGDAASQEQARQKRRELEVFLLRELTQT